MTPLPALTWTRSSSIDFACQELDMRSRLQIWGSLERETLGFAFYAMERCSAPSGVIVDTDFTSTVLERQKRYPNLRIIKGNFGQSTIRDQIGGVDGVFFFDTLLHQVKPRLGRNPENVRKCR